MNRAVRKTSTGIVGLDDILQGGLPENRLTLVCGGAGSGKTVLGMQFLCHGVLALEEPGVMLSFEETPDELAINLRSMGIAIEPLVERGGLLVECIDGLRADERFTGHFDLEGLFVRLEHAVRQVGARRLVIDAPARLFAMVPDERLARGEMLRFARFLKNLGATTLITAERGVPGLTPHGIEEYVSDCVILLDHRVSEEVFTRRLRVVKYRGTAHGTDEFPFLIGDKGMRLMPGTSSTIRVTGSERLSTGSTDIDTLLGGEGLYRGSSTLVTGTAGVGKTLLSSHYAASACRSGERVLYIGFEESRAELARNAALTGADLDAPLREGTLIVESIAPARLGLESHLARMYELVETHEPSVVVVDPISALHRAGSSRDTNRLLLRLMGHLKTSGITALYTMTVEEVTPRLAANVASAMDAWIQLKIEHREDHRHRQLLVTKARGVHHSQASHPVEITARGFRLAGDAVA